MGLSAPRRPFETLRAQIGRVASGDDSAPHLKSNAAVEIVDLGRVAHEMAASDPRIHGASTFRDTSERPIVA